MKNLADKVCKKLEENAQSLESSAGMLILAAISFSTNIGIFPAIMLAVAGLLSLAASAIKDRSPNDLMRSISITIVLFSPLITLSFGKIATYGALFAAAPLMLAATIYRSNGG